MKIPTATARGVVAGAIAASLSALAGPAIAAGTEDPAPGTYDLKDGTTLLVAKNGRMRMFTADGGRRDMKDGVAMQTRNGRVILMKEDLNWKRLRQFGTLDPRSR